MGDREILEIQNLNDDDLLTVYDKIVEHIQYLQSNIINTEEVVEEAVVESEGSGDEQQS